MSDSSYEVVSSKEHFAGRIIAVRTDQVRMPDGSVAGRDLVSHPGAVGVVAVDATDRILMIRQYRPAVRSYLWELPAGLLDAPGEDPAAAAARELREETGISATDWAVLVDVHSSPGMSDEVYRVYLARGLSDKAADFVYGADEESDMTEEWVPMADGVDRVLAGVVTNGLAVAGILAVNAARSRQYAGLRDTATAWPAGPR